MSTGKEHGAGSGTWDFIVIGGGICGLQIGALCATRGRVLLLEKSSGLGGRARVIEKDGFKLDWGAHPVRFGKHSAIARTIKDATGRDIEWLDPGTARAFLADGSRHVFPSGIGGILKTKMVPKLGFIKLFLKLRKDYKRDPVALKNTSLAAYCEREHIDPRLRRFLHMSSAAMQVNPSMERSSTGELVQNMLEVLKKGSVYYPRGGWSTFLDTLATAIRENGETRLNAEVSRILIEDGRARGVLMKDGTTMHAQHVISTIPVQGLHAILDDNLANTPFVQRCKALRCTTGTCIDIALSEPVTTDTLVFFESPPSFGFIPTNIDAGVAPPGKSIMYFFAPADVDALPSDAARKAFQEEFRQAIIAAYPRIPEVTLFERTTWMPMVDGVEIAIDQHGESRPAPDGLAIKGLHLTGDSIGGHGAGGDVGHTSVRECFERIKET